MTVAITSADGKLAGALDPRFGRARCFLLHDPDQGTTEVVANDQNLNAAQGAGIQAAQLVAKAGAQALISGNVGPKAFRVLQAAGIKVYLAASGTCAEALAAFQQGKLSEQSAANVEGHW